MLRIHFTPEDLLRTRFATQPAPMVELTLALMSLRRTGSDLLDHWRHRARRAFPRDALPLLDLVFVDSGPEYLDCLDPDFRRAVDTVLSSSPHLIRSGIDDPNAPKRATPWLRRLETGEREAQHILERALHSAHDTVFGAEWPRVVTTIHTDLAHRRELFLTEGIGAAVASVFRGAVWSGAVLEIPFPQEFDLHLDGCGVVLLPTAHWLGSTQLSRPVPGRPQLVLYPARIPLPFIESSTRVPALTPLLGRTRSAVLEAITNDPSATTSQLATRVGISPGRASEHATVLRDAGLITSHRHRNTVRHVPTSLGRQIGSRDG